MRTINFPTTIVDGFFDFPDEIRSYGIEEITNHHISDRSYPGIRSRFLNNVNPDLYNTICEKILRMFCGDNDPIKWDALMQFQLINKNHGAGWVHKDNNIGIATSVIYLTPNSKNIGTSIYKNKFLFSEKIISETVLFRDRANFNQLNDKEVREENNNNFEEVINVQGVYNRALFFDSQLLHAAHNFVGDNFDSSRLTIVTFFKSIEFCGQLHPIPRVNKKLQFCV